MRVPYFPGCAVKTTAVGFEDSALAVAKELDIELVELPRWNCCGTVHSLTNDDLMHQIAPIRNFVRVQEMNEKGSLEDEYRLVTLCSICYNTLKRSNIVVKNDREKLKTINDAMDREEEYLGKVKIIHFLELLRDVGFEKVAQRVRNPLAGLKVSPYYGCLLLRPKVISIDNLEQPQVLENLLSVLDADVIDNPYKTQCCGSYHTVHRKDLVVELTYKILSYAVKSGAEVMALSCPLCAFNLDQRQEDIQKKYRDFKKIPVLYLSQLIAIAFKLDEPIFDFTQNQVDPRPLLKEKGLI